MRFTSKGDADHGSLPIFPGGKGRSGHWREPGTGTGHDRGSGQGRSVIDTISHHGNLFPFALQPPYLFFFILRKHFSYNTIHADLTPDGLGSLSVIPGQHNYFKP